MRTLLSLFLNPFHKLTPASRAKAHRLAVVVGFLVAIAIGVVVARAANARVPDESPGWLWVQIARLTVYRGPVVLLGFVLGLGLALVAFKAYLRSPQGDQFTYWRDRKDGAWPEEPEIRAAKTLNGGLVLAALILGTLTLVSHILGGS